MRRTIEKIRFIIDKNFNAIRRVAWTLKEFTGYALMYWGEALLGLHKPYRLITRLIENVLQSKDTKLYVNDIVEGSLTVRFWIAAHLPKNGTINLKYVIDELALQLGCEVSDIELNILNEKAYIEITKTAIFNLEKGKTPYMPTLYISDYFDTLIQEARQIVLREGKATPELLQKRLGIGYARASRILNELETIGVLTPPEGNKPRKLVN